MTTPIEALGVPASEFCEPFVEGMRKRMAVSYHKYGLVADATGVDVVASLRSRLDKYDETHNTEWLMDVANFAMMEYMNPAFDDAHYQATDSDASPGRVTKSKENVMGGVTKGHATAAPNRELG